MEPDVARHYTVTELGKRILDALHVSGSGSGALTVDDLAPVDEFHIRGRAATEELAASARIGPDDHVLDVGCGLGGTSRYLADRFGCRVDGIDLTEEYCSVASMLSDRVGLGDRTRFRQASALALPYPDAAFDVVWTEHVQMNIADKKTFYRELARVLKPGGRLAFHDIFAGPVPGLRFPVPWAADAAISHLAGVDEVADLLAETGLTTEHWEDKTAVSQSFFEDALDGPPRPVGLHLLMGADAGEKFANMLANLREDRLRIVLAVLCRP